MSHPRPSQFQASQETFQTFGRHKPPMNPTLKHHVDERHGANQKYKMEEEVFGGDILRRQVSEAIQIREKRG